MKPMDYRYSYNADVKESNGAASLQINITFEDDEFASQIDSIQLNKIVQKLINNELQSSSFKYEKLLHARIKGFVYRAIARLVLEESLKQVLGPSYNKQVILFLQNQYRIDNPNYSKLIAKDLLTGQMGLSDKGLELFCSQHGILSVYETYRTQSEKPIPGIDIEITNKEKPTNDASNAYEELGFTQIDKMEGHQFEYYCAELLRKNDFENVEITKGSGDQGIDILAQKDGIKYAIQCKCYSSDLGNKPVQEAFAGKSVYRCHVAAVLTNRFFTQGAIDAAEATGVLLWDRNKLKSLIDKANG